MLVLCFVWFLDYKGGVGWTENPGKEFNWHPILMSLGLVFLYGQGKFVPSYVIRDADSWQQSSNATRQARSKVRQVRQEQKGEAMREEKQEKRWEGNKERKKTGIEFSQDKQNERKRERKEEKILN